MAKAAAKVVEVTAPKIQTAVIRIRGTAPLVMNKFSNRIKDQIRRAQEAGSTGKKGVKKEPKDFKQCYEEAMHKSPEGWQGIPATAFRCALISACRLVGFAMTRAKLSLFILADGFDADDASPLVKILKGKPRMHIGSVRLETGVIDLRPRPLWDAGWEADVRVQFDADQFTLKDVMNLMCRAGMQVGICEGRPDARKSAGCGWGTFEMIETKR
jgi:hypothetical protein